MKSSPLNKAIAGPAHTKTVKPRKLFKCPRCGVAQEYRVRVCMDCRIGDVARGSNG